MLYCLELIESWFYNYMFIFNLKLRQVSKGCIILFAHYRVNMYLHKTNVSVKLLHVKWQVFNYRYILFDRVVQMYQVVTDNANTII